MPHLHEDKIKFLEEMASNSNSKTAEDIQDGIFRGMSAGRKIKLASNFFEFARKLHMLGSEYGTRRVTEKNRKDS